MSKAISQRLLRLPEVKHLTGLSKSTIYARIAEDSFPRQISHGG
jgi:prophage regulatory protein